MQIKFTYLNKRQMKSCLDISRNSKASIYSKRKTVNKCKVPTSEEVNTFYAHNNSSQIRLFSFYLLNVNSIDSCNCYFSEYKKKKKKKKKCKYLEEFSYY